MATARFQGTVGTQLDNGPLLVEPAGGTAPTASAISTTAVDGDVTTLVVDGASPTQAHVTALNGHWTTLKAAIAAQTVTESGDIRLAFDTTKITSRTKLRQALQALLQVIEASGTLTA